MKIVQIMLAIGVVVSLPVMAEPYAEWGVMGDGMPISEVAGDMRIPEASEVPIPLAPGGVFISADSDIPRCGINIRTERSVQDVCDFYRSKLKTPEYERVEEMELDSGPSCALYRNGDHKQGDGVWVYENEDPAFVKSGRTYILVAYNPSSGKGCDH